jgi:hypothetical protein
VLPVALDPSLHCEVVLPGIGEILVSGPCQMPSPRSSAIVDSRVRAMTTCSDHDARNP